jgi:hypothetical protein
MGTKIGGFPYKVETIKKCPFLLLHSEKQTCGSDYVKFLRKHFNGLLEGVSSAPLRVVSTLRCSTKLQT